MFICILYKPCIISWQFSDVCHEAVDSANDNQQDQRCFSGFRVEFTATKKPEIRKNFRKKIC